MASSDFDIRLKKEAKTSLQVYKDQSLLRRRFGDDAVRLYDLLDSGRPASELIAKLGIPEEKFVEILEFMNNNAMVSVVQPSGAPVAAPPPGDEGGRGEEAEKEEITGEGEEEAAAAPKIPQIRPAAPREKQDQLLSPLEKILSDKYGEIGVRVYNLIDGEKTAEEILRQTGVSEAKLVEILEFMDEQGIIKLEKPEEQSAAAPPGDEGGKGEGEEKEAAQEPRFKPMIEEEPEEKPFVPPKPQEKAAAKKEEKEEEEGEEEVVMVDVPELARLSLMQRAAMFADLSTKFGKPAKDLMGMADGQKDFIDLSLATGLSFFDVDAIMAYFGKKGFISFRQLSREEIKKKYGEDGFAIYKKYGRDGLLLYEMIGKEASLRDIIVKSRIDPDRAIDILIFIHKVLGLDVPIDRNVIYRQLGLKK